MHTLNTFAEIQTLAEQRNNLYQLANENGMVKQELDLLDEGETVYKVTILVACLFLPCLTLC